MTEDPVKGLFLTFAYDVLEVHSAFTLQQMDEQQFRMRIRELADGAYKSLGNILTDALAPGRHLRN